MNASPPPVGHEVAPWIIEEREKHPNESITDVTIPGDSRPHAAIAQLQSNESGQNGIHSETMDSTSPGPGSKLEIQPYPSPSYQQHAQRSPTRNSSESNSLGLIPEAWSSPNKTIPLINFNSPAVHTPWSPLSQRMSTPLRQSGFDFLGEVGTTPIIFPTSDAAAGLNRRHSRMSMGRPVLIDVREVDEDMETDEKATDGVLNELNGIEFIQLPDIEIVGATPSPSLPDHVSPQTTLSGKHSSSLSSQPQSTTPDYDQRMSMSPAGQLSILMIEEHSSESVMHEPAAEARNSEREETDRMDLDNMATSTPPKHNEPDVQKATTPLQSIQESKSLGARLRSLSPEDTLLLEKLGNSSSEQPSQVRVPVAPVPLTLRMESNHTTFQRYISPITTATKEPHRPFPTLSTSLKSLSSPKPTLSIFKSHESKSTSVFTSTSIAPGIVHPKPPPLPYPVVSSPTSGTESTVDHHRTGIVSPQENAVLSTSNEPPMRPSSPSRLPIASPNRAMFTFPNTPVPTKSISQLRQPSPLRATTTGAASKIPRPGSKPYAKPISRLPKPAGTRRLGGILPLPLQNGPPSPIKTRRSRAAAATQEPDPPPPTNMIIYPPPAPRIKRKVMSPPPDMETEPTNTAQEPIAQELSLPQASSEPSQQPPSPTVESEIVIRHVGRSPEFSSVHAAMKIFPPPPIRLKGRGRAAIKWTFLPTDPNALRQLTNSNTLRNQSYYCQLKTEEVLLEGKRPPSPTTKVRTILEKRKGEEKKYREERAARRAEIREGSLDGSLLVDSGVDSLPKHPRGAGEDEDFQTPIRPKREWSNQFADENIPHLKKSVKWNRELHQRYEMDENDFEGIEKGATLAKTMNAMKSCLADTGVLLDPLGNVPNAEIPIEDHTKEQVIVRKVVYIEDLPPSKRAAAIKASGGTNGRSKRTVAT